METPSSYLKKFYKKQGFDGYHSQNYFNRYSLTLDNGSKNITICFLRSNTYRKESKQNFC
jgi:hypothetical protein